MREASFAVLVAARSSGELLLTRRSSKGLLGGLWEFPSVEVTAGEDLEEACCGVAEALCAELPEGVLAWRPLRPVTHVFSHLKAEYRPLLVAAGVRGPAGRKMESSAAEALDCPSRWVAPDRLASLPLPVAQQKILAQALSELGEPALAELALLGVAAQEAR